MASDGALRAAPSPLSIPRQEDIDAQAVADGKRLQFCAGRLSRCRGPAHIDLGFHKNRQSHRRVRRALLLTSRHRQIEPPAPHSQKQFQSAYRKAEENAPHLAGGCHQSRSHTLGRR